MKQALVGCAILAITLFLSSCGPSPSYNFYVSLSGNDAAQCISAAAPCLTLAGALDKASELNTSFAEAADGELPDITYVIHVAAGTYLVEADAPGEPFALLDFNVNILGAGMDVTIFDADGSAGGMLFEGDVDIILRDFTIQNVVGRSPIGFFPEGCIHLRGSVHGLIESVKLDRCLEAGFVNNSDVDADNPIELVDVIVSNTGTLGPVSSIDFSGHGVVNAGALSITNSTISSNIGVGVVSNGILLMNGGVVELNNQSGLVLSGEARLLDVSIRRNGQEGCRGGARIAGECGDNSSAGIKTQNPGSITLTGVNISRNLFGIKIDHPDARLLLENSTVGVNQLAGILVMQGNFRALQSDIIGNATLYSDVLSSGYNSVGGIYVYPNGTAFLSETHIDGNLNGGVANEGNLNLVDTSISENMGRRSALSNSGSAYLENTLIANNRQGEPYNLFSGAIENADFLELLNVTISNNNGFGLHNMGDASISYSTIAFHTYGLQIETGATTIIENSIITENFGPNCLFEGALEPVEIGFNIGTNELVSSCGFSTPLFLVTELMLDELSNNGGFTMTHALLAGSPAIDTAFGDCPISDQRNLPRPFGAACDVGAYETSALAALSGTIATPTVDVPFITVLIDSGCFYGPGLDWPRYSNLSAGTQAEIVGQGFGGGWMVIKHPTIANTNCWIDIDDVDFDIPLDELRLIAIPEKPTPQPTATREDREPTPCPTNQQGQVVCQ